MNIYNVSYDLIDQKNYPTLIEKIKTHKSFHALGSTWLIASNLSAELLFKDLKSVLDKDDKMLVGLAPPSLQWVNIDLDDWLKKHRALT